MREAGGAKKKSTERWWESKENGGGEKLEARLRFLNIVLLRHMQIKTKKNTENKTYFQLKMIPIFKN